MESSTVDLWIMGSSIAMAAGTVSLAIIAGIAAKIALREFKNASNQLKLSAEQASLSAEHLEYSKDLEKKRVSRQRAEVTHLALSRFTKLYYRNHEIMLAEAQKITATREADPNQRPLIRCQISDLFSRERLLAEATPKEVMDALLSSANCIEELGVGVSVGVYDKFVIYHLANDVIRNVSIWSAPFISLLHDGNLPRSPKQPSAYSMLIRLSETLAEIDKKDDPPKLAGALED